MSTASREVLSTVTQASLAPGCVLSTRSLVTRRPLSSASVLPRRSRATTTIGERAICAAAMLPAGRGRAERAHPAPGDGRHAVLPQLTGPLGQRNLAGVAKRQQQLCRALVALAWVGLEAPEDDFLEPRRASGSSGPGRHRVPIEALPQRSEAGGKAEGPRAGHEMVEHRAEGEDVAAGVVPDPQHLLRRDVGCRSHRDPELLGQKVREPVVAGEAEIDQHRLAAVAEHHVARLEIEVDDVLPVQRVQREGDLRADPRHLLRIQRRPLQTGPERVAVDLLHHDVRLGRSRPRR